MEQGQSHHRPARAAGRMRAAADQRALGPDVEDAVRLDLDYAENWSLLRDLMIIAKTVKTVLTADGAY